MKRILKLFVFIFAAALIFVNTTSVHAADSGSIGSNITWEYDGEGTLTLSGSGKMAEVGAYSQPWADYTEDITRVVVGEGITSIADDLFAYHYGLSSVSLPESLTDIGMNAFAGCWKLTGISLPEKLSKLGEYAFMGCVELKEITIPDKISVIERDTFSNCEGLENVVFGKNVETIGYDAFSDCSSLKKISLPEGLKKIDSYAFMNCGLESLVLPENIQIIGSYAFQYNTALTEVEIPESVTEFNGSVFKGCTALRSAVIPANIIYLPDSVFEDCTSLTDVEVKEGVKEIGPACFKGCTSLKKIVLPEGISSLDQQAFQNCTALEEVDASGRMNVMDQCFENCPKLKKFTIDHISYLGRHAFADCTSLEEVRYFDYDSIGDGAFLNCTSLKEVWLSSVLSHINEEAFRNINDDLDLYFVGTEDQWAEITVEEYNTALNDINIHYVYAVTEPQDASAKTGETMNFTIRSTYEPIASYQWQRGYSVYSFEDLEGEKYTGTDADTLTFTADRSESDRYFRCYVTLENGIGFYSQETKLTVTGSDLYPEMIDILNGDLTLIAGQTEALDLWYFPDTVAEPPLTWTIENPDIIEIDKNVVFAKNVGFTKATARTENGLTDEITVRVLFSDVADSGQYFYNPVYWAVDNGITVGSGGFGKFSPNGTCTREQIVTFLWRLMGEPEPETESHFTDVAPSAWYYKPITWAAEKKITVGLNDGTGRFGVGQPCTREQCVTFLYRAAGEPAVTSYQTFTDVKENAYYYKSISWAASNGITVGLNDGTGRFGVGRKCTRAMIVTFLHRYNLLEK